MEKFGLLNLIRALSGQSEQSIGKEEPPSQQENAAASQQQSDAEGRANILADVIERHDAISYRLKNQKKKK